MMIVLAAQEVSSRAQYASPGQFQAILMSLLTTISLVAAFTFKVVLHLQPWHTPRYVIPVVGMLLGNSINGITLSINAISRAFVEESAELELMLAFGATPFEALQRLLAEAILAGATPVLTMLRVTGIISIPGMMTGQLLGGTTTVQAARYQLLILYLIAVCTVGVILLQTLYCALYVGVDTKTHMLVAERFVPKKSNKDKLSAVLGLVTALLAILGFRGDDGLTDTTPASSIKEAMTTKGTIEVQVLKGLQQSAPLLELGGIRRSIQQRVLFENITIDVHAGDLVFVKGVSGSGKSQLVRIVAGLTPADNEVSGTSMMVLSGLGWDQHQHSMGRHTPAHWRRQVRYVPQSKVQMPGTPREFIHRIASFRSWKQQRQSCHMEHQDCPPTAGKMILTMRELLEEWRLHPADTFLDQEWSQLSGGEAQRVTLAIAMASRPLVLLVDESTSALDGESKQAVEQSIVKQLLRQRQGPSTDEHDDGGLSVLWISHDEKQVERMTRALLLDDVQV
ncbi:Cyclolysin secretion/processing ATP-binding protein CyaB [Seminavis robusta]|uniref:Cyclolysin secretion/processing ATP-binding protein CyaB n=1 Tax=Seminavis robusta TaxID=568900 RepID=A0A9N8F4H7_9STRA|nr:Cyclolysin secretion/processing ATP-binding protein CyaB [Seminavis robusta]|eukprot:Sro2898_g339690.1 Cyclolysin secretion/processing ATP-binding protein CyaB (509) ;mRNA; f:89-1825